MSRRLRFQVKPNLNLPAATEEAKPLQASSIAAGDPKSATCSIAAGSSTNNVAVSTESVARRSPTPAPAPAPDPTAATATSEEIAGFAEQAIETPQRLVNTDGNVCVDANEEASCLIASTNENICAEEPNIISSEDPAPAAAAQTSGHKRVDWRVMRNHMKGKQLDRTTFLMKDLIYWCPGEDTNDDKTDDGSTVSVIAPGKGYRKRPLSVAPSSRCPTPLPEVCEKREKEDVKSNAPQVKINADGSIAVDETSLVVDRRDQGTEIDQDLEAIDESSSYRPGRPHITSMSFRRKKALPRGRTWSKFETDKFYRVLAFTGLDFALMHELFPKRSRIEMKRKYKRECNDDPARIDRALSSKIGRLGPWAELKKMIIERGRCTNDERGKELLESARNLIEEEDEKIEFETGRRKPSVAEATRIANQLSKHGFGNDPADEEDVSPEQLQQMAAKIIQDLSKRERRKQGVDSKAQREEYQMKTRATSSAQSLLVTILEKPPVQLTEKLE